ncbi:hypothetical protein [Streptomyces telluris]|uniref:Uncharacterized protein n=1 Tax=Streptomyces telluris TaxID=2720021 RepID=A0A9X2LIU0_9ACTN|nr:hypothetical protein [Streptomyces telluris]MCQ8772114.1 hypothetical protein [Streptomyces telluris]NJP80155.1 hypothetical protein [Streptomyces telluris]
MTTTPRIDVLGLYGDPMGVTDDGFRPFYAAVALTEPVDYLLTEESAAALDHADRGGRWRRRARAAGGGAFTTDDPLVGVLGALAARAAARPGDLMLRWVEPYLRQVSAHDYRIDRPDRPCVLNGGRGSAQIWRAARETISGACEAAFRWSFHCHSADVPVDVVIAIAHLWSVVALADEHHAGPECAAETKKLAEVTLDHMSPHLDRPGATEQIWLPTWGMLVSNMATRLTYRYHDPSTVPMLADRLAMRAVDVGSSAQIAHNAFYAGLSDHPLLDEWKIATALSHDMWQISHDEAKAGDDFNACSMLLKHGTTVSELADYITYLSCSTEMPSTIRHCFDGWSVLTLTSVRHVTHLPETPPRRDRLWDPDAVARVRKSIGISSAPIADTDPSLSGADLDQAGIEHLLDPDNCRSYTACISNTAEAVRIWREYVYRFDVISGLLSRSKYASTAPSGLANL